MLEKLREHLELECKCICYFDIKYEATDVTSDTNDVIVLLTIIYFVRIITTVKVATAYGKFGYIFTVVTLMHVKQTWCRRISRQFNIICVFILDCKYNYVYINN